MAKTTKTSSDTWKSRYDLAQNSQERMYNKFQSWYDAMYAHINTSQYALWRSKVFLPIIPAKAKGMISKLQSLDPGWEIGLYGDALLEDDAQEKSQKAQWKLEHDWDNPHFDEPMRDKLFSPLMDAVVTGTGIAKVPWCFGDATRYEKYKDDNKELDLTRDVKITTSRGYNDLIPHDIMSTYIAPGAKNLYSAQWVILEDWVTYKQLEQENEAAGGELYDKSGLAEAKELKSDTDRFSTQKQSRDLIVSNEDPLETDTTVTQIKRLECYEKSTNMRYVFAVGTGGDSGEESFVELTAKKNIYWHGKYPLVAFYVTKRPHQFWGQGIFEDTERLQSAFNDIFNHYMDNLNLSLDGMIMKQEGEEFNYIVEPGGEFIYQNEKPEQFKFPEPNANQFDTVMNFIEKQVEDTTISSYATGAPNSATDNTAGTATGIMRLQEAAGDKIANMKSQFANSLREVGRQWLSNNQQFLDRPFTLMGQENSKPAPVTINPEDLQGEMILRINDSSMEPTTKEQRMEQFDQRIAQLLQLQQASIQQSQLTGFTTPPVLFDFTALVQDAIQVHGQEDLEKILLNEEEAAQAVQSIQQNMAAQAQANAPQEKPAQEPKAPSESLNYKDAPEDIKRQIEQQAGLEPSSMPSPQAISDTVNMHNALNGGLNGQEEQGEPGGAGTPGNSSPNADRERQLAGL